jgi:hypothetical protein
MMENCMIDVGYDEMIGRGRREDFDGLYVFAQGLSVQRGVDHHHCPREGTHLSTCFRMCCLKTCWARASINIGSCCETWIWWSEWRVSRIFLRGVDVGGED